MTQQEIEDTLIKGIADITGRGRADIAPDMPFHDMGIDSLGFIEILVFIEKTFKLQLIASDLTKRDFETVSTLAASIKRSL